MYEPSPTAKITSRSGAASFGAERGAEAGAEATGERRADEAERAFEVQTAGRNAELIDEDRILRFCFVEAVREPGRMDRHFVPRLGSITFRARRASRRAQRRRLLRRASSLPLVAGAERLVSIVKPPQPGRLPPADRPHTRGTDAGSPAGRRRIWMTFALAFGFAMRGIHGTPELITITSPPARGADSDRDRSRSSSRDRSAGSCRWR